VILNHMGVPFVPQGRGVLTFFVLSGFLITWMLLNESEKYQGISIRNFYVRRVLRIFPAYYAFLILQLLFIFVTGRQLSPTHLHDYLSLFSYTSNYWFALVRAGNHVNTHTWALAVEEQFYLLWPLCFAAFQKDLRKLSYLLIATIFVVDIYRIVLLFQFHVHEVWLKFTFDSRVDHLLVGCLLAVLIKRGALTALWNFLVSRTWISLIPFGFIVGSIALAFHYGRSYQYAVGFVVDPLFTALLLVQVIAFSNSWLWGWLNWRPIRYLGQISYAVFLYHMLAHRFVTHFLGQGSLWIHIPAVIAVSVLLGACSYHLLELRFLALKSRFMRTPEKPTIPALTPPYELARV
jgi:peptidoglycan/LPS O-acetylase OafA/YrhL